MVDVKRHQSKSVTIYAKFPSHLIYMISLCCWVIFVCLFVVVLVLFSLIAILCSIIVSAALRIENYSVNRRIWTAEMPAKFMMNLYECYRSTFPWRHTKRQLAEFLLHRHDERKKTRSITISLGRLFFALLCSGEAMWREV